MIEGSAPVKTGTASEMPANTGQDTNLTSSTMSTKEGSNRLAGVEQFTSNTPNRGKDADTVALA
jgi:hypothetical protein